MQKYTGELREIADGDGIPDGFQKVPNRLKRDAEKVVEEALSQGTQEFYGRPIIVNGKTQHGQNMKAWARNERKKVKRKRKIARESKKKNR